MDIIFEGWRELIVHNDVTTKESMNEKMRASKRGKVVGEEGSTEAEEDEERGSGW